MVISLCFFFHSDFFGNWRLCFLSEFLVLWGSNDSWHLHVKASAAGIIIQWLQIQFCTFPVTSHSPQTHVIFHFSLNTEACYTPTLQTPEPWLAMRWGSYCLLLSSLRVEMLRPFLHGFRVLLVKQNILYNILLYAESHIICPTYMSVRKEYFIIFISQSIRASLWS